MRNRYKRVPTESYFYLARQLAKCMMRLNSHVVPIRTKTTNTRKMNSSEMITQKIPNSHVCSMDESK